MYKFGLYDNCKLPTLNKKNHLNDFQLLEFNYFKNVFKMFIYKPYKN